MRKGNEPMDETLMEILVTRLRERQTPFGSIISIAMSDMALPLKFIVREKDGDYFLEPLGTSLIM